MSKINKSRIFLLCRLFGAGTIALALRPALRYRLPHRIKVAGRRYRRRRHCAPRRGRAGRLARLAFLHAGVSFAGDSGALFAGALAAFGCLIVIARARMSPLVAPILFFPLLADALLTLLYRARRGAAARSASRMPSTCIGSRSSQGGAMQQAWR